MLRLLCLAFLAALTIAAPASAVESEMIGTPNFSFVTNLQYEHHWEAESNGGSDIEFFELPMPSSSPATAPSAPAPAKPAAKTKKKSRYAKCAKKAKRKKGSARRKALKKCKKLEKSKVRARRS